MAQESDFYEISFTNPDKTPLPMSQFRGKVVMVVNTASECGFRNQYYELEALYQKYRDRGFVIIAVPSNDFGGQEPKNICEIETSVRATYKISFPIVDKEHVTGDHQHPFYVWAKKKAGLFGKPMWNFHKYLIDRQGNFVDSFSTLTSPDAKSIENAIEKLL